MKISGYINVRNGIRLDYAFREAILSLVPACDELVICDSDSDDGTTEVIKALAEQHPTIRYINRPWTNPVRELTWWTSWLNWTREQLIHPIQLTLDADEILCPKSIPTIRAAADHGECRWFHRLNFWRDAQTIVPHGTVCGEQVVRLAPSELWLPSDEPHPEGEPEARKRAGWPPNATPDLRIFHYGFLRKQEAFINKVRVVNGAFFGTFDERLNKPEKEGTPWIDEYPFAKPFLDYQGEHPEVAHQWLKERGYDPQ